MPEQERDETACYGRTVPTRGPCPTAKDSTLRLQNHNWREAVYMVHMSCDHLEFSKSLAISLCSMRPIETALSSMSMSPCGIHGPDNDQDPPEIVSCQVGHCSRASIQSSPSESCLTSASQHSIISYALDGFSVPEISTTYSVSPFHLATPQS